MNRIKKDYLRQKYCLYNVQKIPERCKLQNMVLFERQVDYPAMTMVVSQDPAVNLVQLSQQKNLGLEELLLYHGGLLDKVNVPRTNTLPGFIRKVLFNGIRNLNFLDPMKSKIFYWTHVLKCCPAKDNSEFQTDWQKCNCINFLVEEIDVISPAIIIVIGFGAGNVLKKVLESNNIILEKVEEEKQWQSYRLYFGNKKEAKLCVIHHVNSHEERKEGWKKAQVMLMEATKNIFC